jgi:4-amino-4-deoxy-L-arabinose transferase-like glycosyltransferase
MADRGLGGDTSRGAGDIPAYSVPGQRSIPGAGTANQVAGFLQLYRLAGAGLSALVAVGVSHLAVIQILQALLGIGITLLLFRITYLRHHNLRSAFLVGLSYSLCLHLLFFESLILSETLSAFLLLLSLLIVQKVLMATEPKPGLTLLAGLVTGLAILTRPLMVFLIPVYVIVLWLRPARSRRMARVGAFLVTSLLCVIGWCLVNLHFLNYFGLTILTGFNLSNHSGRFIELAPERYATVREIYLQYREAEIAKTQSHAMTIWMAMPELQRRTGMSQAELSREFTQLSLYLFIHHPTRYLNSVRLAARNFWLPFNYWGDNGFRAHLPGGIVSLAHLVWEEERPCLSVVNTLFILLVLWAVLAWLSRRRILYPHIDRLVSVVIVVACISQALLEYGENYRYIIPFQPLVIMVVAGWIWQTIAGTNARSGPTEQMQQ